MLCHCASCDTLFLSSLPWPWVVVSHFLLHLPMLFPTITFLFRSQHWTCIDPRICDYRHTSSPRLPCVVLFVFACTGFLPACQFRRLWQRKLAAADHLPMTSTTCRTTLNVLTSVVAKVQQYSYVKSVCTYSCCLFVHPCRSFSLSFSYRLTPFFSSHTWPWVVFLHDLAILAIAVSNRHSFSALCTRHTSLSFFLL